MELSCVADFQHTPPGRSLREPRILSRASNPCSFATETSADRGGRTHTVCAMRRGGCGRGDDAADAYLCPRVMTLCPLSGPPTGGFIRVHDAPQRPARERDTGCTFSRALGARR